MRRKLSCSWFLALLFVLVHSLHAQSLEEILAGAERLYRLGRFEDAVAAYKTVLGKEPANLRAHLGLARTLLKKDDVAEASEVAGQASKLAPESAALRVLLGDIYYRKGDFEKAHLSYLSAIQSDKNVARAYWGAGRVLLTECRYRSAKSLFQKAYELEPDDPDVLLAWGATLQKAADKIPAMERYLGLATNEEVDKLDSIRSWMALMQRIGDQKTFLLQRKPRSSTIPLETLYRNRWTAVGLGIKVSFNGGKAQKLLLDTGARGILINRKTAEKFGVKPLAASPIRGIGDEGTRGGYTGWVDIVRIGDLEFRDSIVEVADKKVLDDVAGVIGVNIFSDYLIKLDYPRQVLELLPLAGETDNTEDDQGGWEFERQISPEMKSFTPVRKIGQHLLVRTKVNDRKQVQFVIDTGANVSLISSELAKEVTDTIVDKWTDAKGMSGYVKGVYRAAEVSLEFAGLRQKNLNMVSFDLRKLSKSAGTEISGVLGYSVLRYLTIFIDYRNGLVKFLFQK